MKGVSAALEKALSAERQAISIYAAELPLLRWRKFEQIATFDRILAEEREHAGMLEEEMGALATRGASWIDHLGGTIFGFLLGMLPQAVNFRVHAWAEREAAKSYWTARAFVLHTRPEKTDLARTLGRMARQELAHRRSFLKLLKGDTHG